MDCLGVFSCTWESYSSRGATPVTIGNRRKTERLHMLAGARVRVGGVSHEALLHDCSRIGCRLTMDQELPRGEEVHLTLALPGSNFPIEVEGVVTWCSPIDFSQSFQLGFRLVLSSTPRKLSEISISIYIYIYFFSVL